MNAMLMHATQRAESIRPLSNDERRASWAARYFALGLHRRPDKPRIRVTVPAPLSNTTSGEPDKDSSHE